MLFVTRICQTSRIRGFSRFRWNLDRVLGLDVELANGSGYVIELSEIKSTRLLIRVIVAIRAMLKPVSEENDLS